MPGLDGSSLLLLIALTITLGNTITVAIWPFKRCRTCHGTGTLRSPIVRAVRLCRRCESTGLRPRLALKAWNAFRRLRRELRTDRTKQR